MRFHNISLFAKGSRVTVVLFPVTGWLQNGKQFLCVVPKMTLSTSSTGRSMQVLRKHVPDNQLVALTQSPALSCKQADIVDCAGLHFDDLSSNDKKGAQQLLDWCDHVFSGC
jgi:hypothetical protein